MKAQEKLIFASIDAKKSLDEKIAFCSEEKSDLLRINIKSRTRMIERVLGCSAESAAILETNLSDKALGLLMQSPNVYTSERIVHAANLISCTGRTSTILSRTLKALNTNNVRTMSELCADINQCYSRVGNAVKALTALNVVDATNCIIDRDDPRIIIKMSADTIVTLIKQQ